MKHAVRSLVPVAIPLLLLGGIAAVVLQPAVPRTAAIPLSVKLQHLQGVAVAKFAQLPTFEKATAETPSIVEVYYGFGKLFPYAQADAITRQRALPLIELNPQHTELAAIAAGKYDSYLDAYAKATAAFRDPVVISFGHEMNGEWYSWGYRHTLPAVFVAAWRHIVSLFRGQDARNVIWLWTVNIGHPGNRQVSPIAPWWPGGSYVTWVGIDGYFRLPSDTFATLFGATFVQVRALTTKPVLITETAVAPGPAAAGQVASLFNGVRSYGMLGYIWFDAVGTQDWRIEDDPPALAAFRREARTYSSAGSWPSRAERAHARRRPGTRRG